jgi:vesicle-associated membrane protein 7
LWNSVPTPVARCILGLRAELCQLRRSWHLDQAQPERGSCGHVNQMTYFLFVAHLESSRSRQRRPSIRTTPSPNFERCSCSYCRSAQVDEIKSAPVSTGTLNSGWRRHRRRQRRCFSKLVAAVRILIVADPRSACIAHGTTILTEHTSPGTSASAASSLASVILPKISHSTPAKLTYTHDKLFVHYIADSPSSSSNAPDEQLSSHAALTYLVVAQAELGRRIPFAFLLELKKKFLGQFEPDSTDFQSMPAYGAGSFNTQLKSMLQQFNISPPSDSLSNARREIDSVKDIMTENIERVLERGERIDLLVDKTDRLGGSARDFRVRSRGLRRQMWWKNVRVMVLLVVVVIFLIYLFVGFGCGLPGWGRCIGR